MKTLRKTLSKKWIAWLAAVCLLAALIPLSAVLTQAESETVYFEFLGRLPNGNEQNIVQLSVSADGETWTEATRLTGFDDGNGSPAYGGGQYAKVDITEFVDLTADALYVRMNLSAGIADWCSVEQMRVSTDSAELLYVKYDEMAAGSEDYKNGALDSSNVQLATFDNKTTLQPLYAGVLEMCQVTYKIDLGGEEEPAQEKVYFEYLGRLPNGNEQNIVQLSVSADGETWTEATRLTGFDDGNGGPAYGGGQYAKVDITEFVDLTADALYVRMNLSAGIADWCSVEQMRVSTDSKELLYVKYDEMAAGSEDYKNGALDSSNVQLVTFDNKTTLQPLYAGVLEMCQVTYKIDLGGESGGEQLPEETYTVDKLTFEYLGRLPDTGDNKNKVIVSLSTDGENWEEVYTQNPFKVNGETAWGGGQYSDVVDITEAAANFIGTEVPALYVRFGLNAGIVDWCSVEQMRIIGAVDGGAEQELLYEKYDEMAAKSEDYRTAKYIDSAMVRLLTFDGKTTLQPATAHNVDAENQCYIVYKLLGTVNPDEVTPGQGGDSGNEGGSGGGAPSEGVVLGNTVSLGYKADFNKMEDASTDWQNDAYAVSAMKVFFDSGDNYTMLCPDASQNVHGIGYATYKLVAEEGKNLGLVGVSMVGRIFNYPDASEDRYLTVEYSLDDGATWQTAKHYVSGTNGNKSQNYRAILGVVGQNAVLVRIMMSSGMNDWVGLQSLEFMTPASVKPGFLEDFGIMRPNSSNYQANAFNFNTTRVYADTQSGYTSLTTDMNVTDQGKSFIEYLVLAEDGKTLDGLKLVMTGRIFDFNNDANRGVAVSVSDDYGVSYVDVDRIAAGEDSSYEQYYEMDLSQAAAGKTSLLVRLDINSAHWDWVGLETIELTTDDVSDGGDDNTGDGNTGDDNTGDDNTGDDNTGDDNTGDDNTGDDNDSPETGSALPYAAFAVVLMAGLCVAILRKKQIN